MSRFRKTRSGEQISFRPKFRGGKKRGEGRDRSFLKRFTGKLGASLRKGKGRATRYSHGRGKVHKTPHLNAQRVVVKARVARNKGGSLGKHSLYLERQGAGLNGEQGRLFSEYGYLSEKEKLNWLKEAANDRHHFRLIVSPEHAKELDLQRFANEFAAGLESDLESKLKWLSVVHGNTDNPHVHFIIRGVTDTGSDLVINRQYISNGMRGLASKLVTKELGHRRESEVIKERRASVVQERFTWFDRKLLENGGVFDCREGTWRKLLFIGRLQFLKSRGLATETDVGMWQVDPALEEKLRALGKKGDIIKTMHEMSGRRVERKEPGANVSAEEEEKIRRNVRVSVELEREGEESIQKERRVRNQGAERVRSQFLLRLIEKGRER